MKATVSPAHFEIFPSNLISCESAFTPLRSQATSSVLHQPRWSIKKESSKMWSQN